MDAYDPLRAPEPAAWLEMDEQERNRLVEDFHLAAQIPLPDVSIHAVFHVIIENQIAERLQPVILAMERLRREGLDRHDALHAVASVLSEHVYADLNQGDRGMPGTLTSRYATDLGRLTARSWRKRYGSR